MSSQRRVVLQLKDISRYDFLTVCEMNYIRDMNCNTVHQALVARTDVQTEEREGEREETE